jgi:hypothetical protein
MKESRNVVKTIRASRLVEETGDGMSSMDAFSYCRYSEPVKFQSVVRRHSIDFVVLALFM